MDGIGRTLKILFYREVMPGKFVFNTFKQFAEYAEGSVKGIASLYRPT